MNFRPELAAAVMDGRKTVTRRLVSLNTRSPWWIKQCALVPGRTYAVCPGRGKNAIGRVLVRDVRCEPLGEIGDQEAQREGFTTQRDFDDAWVAINGIWDPKALVWRVEFEVADDA
jgi:hypothetical protein